MSVKLKLEKMTIKTNAVLRSLGCYDGAAVLQKLPRVFDRMAHYVGMANRLRLDGIPHCHYHPGVGGNVPS